MNMIYKETTTHNVFECEVRYRVNKPKIICFLCKHLILDCGISDYKRGMKPTITRFSQAETSIFEWYNSGGWTKIICSEKDREEWRKYINVPSAFEEIEIRKMEKTWFIFLQDPNDYQDRLDVCWIQVNSVLRIKEESNKRPKVNRERFLVAIPSTEKNQDGYYVFKDDMKEQAISMVRDHYSYALEKDCKKMKVDVELFTDRKFIDYVVCPDGIAPGITDQGVQ